jgi:hypothetical protein
MGKVFGVEAYMVSPTEARAKALIDLNATGGLFIPPGRPIPPMSRRRWPRRLASAACASLRTLR